MTWVTWWSGVAVEVRGTPSSRQRELLDLGREESGADHTPDVVVHCGARGLPQSIQDVPDHLPVCVLVDDSELELRRLPTTTLALTRSVTRVNLLMLEDLRSCAIFSRTRVPLPVARHGGQQDELHRWVSRAHAYGPVLPPRP